MEGFEFQYQVIFESLPVLMKGVQLTLLITLVGLLVGFILGALFGIMKTLRSKILNKTAGVYIECIRGTPLMVQVMFMYFGLPLLLGIRFPPLMAGITAIGLNSGAYIAEIVRGAVQSIDKGQTEAGLSIGLNKPQVMLYIVWPQALKRMIPPLGNQFVISLKDTSLLVVIGVGELTRQGQEIIAYNFRAFEVWLTVAILYLIMTLVISRLLRFLENKLNISS